MAMAIYSVYLPPESGNEASDRTVFLGDGPALLALIVPIVWLLWHRLWLEAALYVLIMVAFGVSTQFGYPEIGAFLSFLPGLYLMLEGRELVRCRYERSGWHFDGVVEAGDIEAAELRYFSNFVEATRIEPPKTENQPKSPIFSNHIRRPAPIGLFPE